MTTAIEEVEQLEAEGYQEAERNQEAKRQQEAEKKMSKGALLFCYRLVWLWKELLQLLSNLGNHDLGSQTPKKQQQKTQTQNGELLEEIEFFYKKLAKRASLQTPALLKVLSVRGLGFLGLDPHSFI